jgi:hypothetical protein
MCLLLCLILLVEREMVTRNETDALQPWAGVVAAAAREDSDEARSREDEW